MGDALGALTNAVKAEAQRLGFELVGVTTPEPPPHLQAYEKWLEAGRNASMAYLGHPDARARRADPRLILPECQSILVLGIRYNAPDGPSSSSPSSRGERQRGTDLAGRGRIASYAWGDDYHLVLPPRLCSIVAFLEQQVGHPIAHRYYTDTGPVLERELAQRAGLGWIGKNTLLINPKHGSYFLLAEIFLDIALEPDAPLLSDHCGTCMRCIEACPTECILPNRTLDAGRCISYLTIENKEKIPVDLRPLMGDWIFGCDICQTVCPWNIRFASQSGDAALAPREGIPLPVLREELTQAPQEFSRKFKNSPVKRTRRRGYLRNVAVALGNSGSPSDLPALEQALREADALIRDHVVAAIEQIKCRPVA